MRDREKNWPRQFSGRRRLSLINYFCPRGSRQRPRQQSRSNCALNGQEYCICARFRFSDSSIRVLRLYARMRTDSVMTAASLRRRTPRSHVCNRRVATNDDAISWLRPPLYMHRPLASSLIGLHRRLAIRRGVVLKRSGGDA